MKKTYFKFLLLLTGFLLLMPQGSRAQKLSYAYDNAGNRVSRTIVFNRQQAAKTQKKDSVSFNEILANKEIKLYPNPVQTDLTVTINGFDKDVAGEYFLFDNQGRMLLHSKMNAESFQLEMSSYATGNYIMRIVINGESTTWKILKK